MNHPTQEQFKAALESLMDAGRLRFHPCCGEYRHVSATAHAPSRTRSEPPAERRDCDEMPLGVPRG